MDAVTGHPNASGTAARRRLRRVATVAVALLTLAVAAAAAQAATPDQIARDARDGRIDGGYTVTDLRAGLASPLLKTYGGANGVEAVKEALGAQTEGTAGSGGLPFTGAELITFVTLGSTLIVAGFVLRRQRPEHEPDGGG